VAFRADYFMRGNAHGLSQWRGRAGFAPDFRVADPVRYFKDWKVEAIGFLVKFVVRSSVNAENAENCSRAMRISNQFNFRNLIAAKLQHLNEIRVLRVRQPTLPRST
jgi:hypothetical protein